MGFEKVATKIHDAFLLYPKIHGDSRGFFLETWSKQSFEDLELSLNFVQDNHSRSEKNVLRGLHFQIQQAQGKLVRVIQGAVFDVAVDIRKSSPTFGQHVAIELSAENQRMLWVPEGFAHGFLVTSATAEFLYKTTAYYAPEYERSIAWNDPALAIAWPIEGAPSLSAKDQQAPLLADVTCFA